MGVSKSDEARLGDTRRSGESCVTMGSSLLAVGCMLRCLHISSMHCWSPATGMRYTASRVVLAMSMYTLLSEPACAASGGFGVIIWFLDIWDFLNLCFEGTLAEDAKENTGRYGGGIASLSQVHQPTAELTFLLMASVSIGLPSTGTTFSPRTTKGDHLPLYWLQVVKHSVQTRFPGKALVSEAMPLPLQPAPIGWQHQWLIMHGLIPPLRKPSTRTHDADDGGRAPVHSLGPTRVLEY